MMVGNKIGSEGEYQGYMGIASYLNTGKQKIKKNKGVFYIVEPDFNSNEGGDARTKREDSHSDSDIGAPAGPYDVCISERKSDGSCGADQVFNTSTFKYSIFGCMKRYPDKGQDGFPAEMDRWGLRMKLSTVGFDPNNLKLNGRDYYKEREMDDIRKLSIMHESGGVEIEFPYKFNAGSFSSDATDKFYFRETKSDMNIVVHNATQDGSIYIDYFFEEWIMNGKDYVVYDPVLKFVKYTPESNAAPMAATVNVFAVALLGVFSVITLQA